MSPAAGSRPRPATPRPEIDLTSAGGDVLRTLLRRVRRSNPDTVAAVLCQALCELGGRRVALYLVDYDQDMLLPLTSAIGSGGVGTSPASQSQPVGASLAGRAFLSHQVVAVDAEEGHRLWVPVLERSDGIGVLELVLDGPDHPLAAEAAELGPLMGQELHSASRYTDVFELGRRGRPMNLAAEMQWSMLLPALTFRTDMVSIAGTLEPAYDIGGDSFDYAANAGVVDLCILDAMGHGLDATLASALALGSYRFGRRQGLDLAELAQSIDTALDAQWQGERFATGHLARLDSATGLLRWVNAGHPTLLLIRQGRVVAEPACETCLPLGLGIEPPTVCQLALEPDDRILFYSDGATEARGPTGEQFGLERLRSAVEGELDDHRPTAQVLRRIVHRVLDHRQGQDLADDVTFMLVHWHPPPKASG